MSFKSTLDVLNALKAKLEALTWTPAGGVAEPAFKKVELFDITELDTAMSELFIFKDRVCLVVLDSENYENDTLTSTKLLSKQTRSVALVIADRNFGKRQRALIGSDGSPGVLVLKDLIL